MDSLENRELALGALRKRRSGEVLTKDEKAAVREYYGRYRRASTVVYWFSEEERRRYQTVARKGGASSFSGWIADLVRREASPEALLRQEVMEFRSRAGLAERMLEMERDLRRAEGERFLEHWAEVRVSLRAIRGKLDRLETASSGRHLLGPDR